MKIFILIDQRREDKSVHNQRGSAMGISMLLTLMFTSLLGAVLVTSLGQSRIGKEHVSTMQSYYLAEAGLKKSAIWFSKNFSTDPKSGLFVLPMRNTTDSPNPTRLNYVDPLSSTSGQLVNYSYSAGTAANTVSDDKLITSVKIGYNGQLRNVVLSGDASNTYPNNYTVMADDSTGTPKSYNISGVVDKFTSELVEQQQPHGRYSVKAILVALNPPATPASSGTATWRIISKGRSNDGSEKTLVAELSAALVPFTKTETVTTTTQTFVGGGVFARGALRVDKNAQIDSYKSTLGDYGATILGIKNVGSDGDIRSNGFGKKGIILVRNGSIVNGDAAISTAYDGKDNAKKDPILEEKKGDVKGNKYYGVPELDFLDVAPVPRPPKGSPHYHLKNNESVTFSKDSYEHIHLHDKSSITLPPGTYGKLHASNKSSTVTLGVAGSTSPVVYNFHEIKLDNSTLVIQGPVIINVTKEFKLKGAMTIASSLKPKDIRLNVQDDSGKKNDEDIEDDTYDEDGDVDEDDDGLSDDIYVDSGDTKGGKVKIDGGRFYSVIYAPGSKVDIKKGAEVFGSVVGYQVKVKENSKIHIDETLLSGLAETTTVTTTTQVIVGYSTGSYGLRYK